MMRRLILLLALAPLSTCPAEAGTREDVYQAFIRCNSITDNRTWLDCIYGAAQPMRAVLGLAPAPDNQVRLVPQTGASIAMMHPPSSLAATHPPPKKESVLSYMLGGRKEVEATPFRSYSFDSSGYFTVTLVNGQTWRQVDDDHHMASWKGDPSRYVASIKTGSLGSSILQVSGDAGGFMVRQVR